MTDLPTPTTAPPAPGQLTFTAPRRGRPPRHLADLTSKERRDVVESLGHKGFRGKQLSTHYFERLVDTPDQMTDLPKGVRDDLVRDLLPTLLTPMVQRTADDGQTVKYAWRLHDGAIVESVLMRYPNRVTMCISSQAGCGMNCFVSKKVFSAEEVIVARWPLTPPKVVAAAVASRHDSAVITDKSL